jgi:anti-anti-sigma regulatory factor
MNGQQANDLTITADASGVTVAINGALTIERCGEFRQALVDALAGAQHVVLEFGRVHDMDIPVLQLICSACKTAAAANKSFTFAGTLPESLTVLKESLGVCQNSPCSQNNNTSCLWFGGAK